MRELITAPEEMISLDELRPRRGKRNRGSLKKGYDSRRGHGLKGRAGPKTKDFKKMCLELTNGPTLRKRLRSIVRSGQDKDVIAAAKFLAEYAHEKVASNVNVRTTPLEDLLGGEPIEGTITK